jgi:hypothetical protein
MQLPTSAPLLLLPLLLLLSSPCWVYDDDRCCPFVLAFQPRVSKPTYHPYHGTNTYPHRIWQWSFKQYSPPFAMLQSTTQPPQHQSLSNNDIERESLMGRRFQLEEKEDRANCITELLLNSDHTVAVGQSDGPLFTIATGSWSFDQELFPLDVAFAMTLDRTFKAGYKGTDMGEFTFVVSRTYVGSLTQVGGVIAVEGSIYKDPDEEDDGTTTTTAIMGRVGFFSMIDTTPTKDEEEDDDDDDEGNDNNNQRPNFMMRTSASI